jgi:hypothetical protein
VLTTHSGALENVNVMLEKLGVLGFIQKVWATANALRSAAFREDPVDAPD